MEKDLFVWSDLDDIETKKEVLEEHGFSRKGFVRLAHYYDACYLCGLLDWRPGPGDPYHVEGEDSWAADSETNREVLIERYVSLVRIHVVEPDGITANPRTCKNCESAIARNPEVMTAVARMIRFAVYLSGRAK